MDRRTVVLGMAAAGLSTATAPAGGGVAWADSPGPRAGGDRGIELRWAFSVALFFNERVRIQAPRDGTSARDRAFVPAVGGTVWGPRLDGTVVPYGGADYGGDGPLDAQYMLESDDGYPIFINNRAYMKALGERPAGSREPGPAGPGEPFSQRMGGDSLASVELRMRTVPFFDAPIDSPYNWMNHTLFVGHGARHVNPDHTLFTYYEVL